jgi:hypothetical protein
VVVLAVVYLSAQHAPGNVTVYQLPVLQGASVDVGGQSKWGGYVFPQLHVVHWERSCGMRAMRNLAAGFLFVFHFVLYIRDKVHGAEHKHEYP